MRIRNVDQLVAAAQKRQSVTIPGTVYHKFIPASFLLSQQAVAVNSLIKRGMFIYRPKQPKKPKYYERYSSSNTDGATSGASR